MAATVVAIVASLAGLAYLTGTDPKRRRAFRLPPAASSHPRLGWAAVLGPGIVLPVFAGGGGFTIWIGAVSVIGWAMAALPPERTALVGRRCAALVDRIAAFRPARPAWPMRPATDDRVAALEARVRALEAQLAAGDAPAESDPAPRPRSRKTEAVRPN
ncbi:MAG: hypothetical protein QM699_12520 [Amaricoccus sp.]|uniref:hypothetical protein n=1 Tax=Amaricoccus sp. TaxID=1872485 RepID=UPI0039E5A536